MGDAELMRLIHARRAQAPAPGLEAYVSQTKHTLADVSRAALEARAREVLGDKVADAFCATAAVVRTKAADAEARERDNNGFAVQHAEGGIRHAAAAPARVTLKTAAARDGGSGGGSSGGGGGDGGAGGEGAGQSYLARFGSAPVSTGASNARAIAAFGPVRLSAADLASVLHDRVKEDREIERLRPAAAKPAVAKTAASALTTGRK